jgi:RNAse III (EC 3.1.26.3)
LKESVRVFSRTPVLK